MSVFTRPGLYLRNPRGGVENVAAMRLDGFTAIALNVRDHELGEWQRVIERADAAGVAWLPWAHCHTDEEVAALCKLARALPQRRVIVNAEKELLDGRMSLDAIERETRDLDACLCTEPWVGTPPLELRRLPKVTVHLGLFPQEPGDADLDPRGCRAHAYGAGASRVEFMLGVHDVDSRAFPPRAGAFWGYTGDDMGADYASWRPEILPPLTLPYTGPLYGPEHVKWGATPAKTGTAKALKIALHNAGFGNFPKPDLFFNRPLEYALKRMQRWAGLEPVSGAYGKGSYEIVRRLASAEIGGTYALTQVAEKLIRDHARLAA